jgi:hypothetical protein
LIPFLFAGKVTLEELPVLHQYHQQGIISMPKYIPPQIKDLNGIGVWLAFSEFINGMKIQDILTENKNLEKTNPFKKIA